MTLSGKKSTTPNLIKFTEDILKFMDNYYNDNVGTPIPFFIYKPTSLNYIEISWPSLSFL